MNNRNITNIIISYVLRITFIKYYTIILHIKYKIINNALNII